MIKFLLGFAFTLILVVTPQSSLSNTKANDQQIQTLKTELSKELKDEIEESPQAAQKLVSIGTKESMQTLIQEILKARPNRESMGIIYSLHDFPNPLIAEWIAGVLSNTKEDEEQILHHNMLTAVGGGKASPDSLNYISKLVSRCPTNYNKALVLSIISESSSPDTYETLVSLAKTDDLQNEVSISSAALVALALRGEKEGIEFSFREMQNESSEEKKILRGQAISLISKPEAAKTLIEIANGNSAFGKALFPTELTAENPYSLYYQPQIMAIVLLGKFDNEYAWQTLYELSKDTNANSDIAYLAKESLSAVKRRTGHDPSKNSNK